MWFRHNIRVLFTIPVHDVSVVTAVVGGETSLRSVRRLTRRKQPDLTARSARPDALGKPISETRHSIRLQLQTVTRFPPARVWFIYMTSRYFCLTTQLVAGRICTSYTGDWTMELWCTTLMLFVSLCVHVFELKQSIVVCLCCSHVSGGACAFTSCRMSTSPSISSKSKA